MICGFFALCSSAERDRRVFRKALRMFKSEAMVLAIKLCGWVVVGIYTVEFGSGGRMTIREIVLLQFV